MKKVLPPRQTFGELLRGQLDKDLDVVVREIPGHSVDRTFEPVFVDLTDQMDNFTLLKAKLSLVLRLKVI